MPKVDVIRANAARYPISAQCRIPGVPRSTYYWMTGHPETEHVDPIAGDVRAIWRDSRERYDARKIKAALERRGVTASRKRIGGIMREQGMTSAYMRRRSEPHGILRAWFRLLVFNRGSFVLANEEIVHRTRAMPFTSKTETQSAQEFGRYRYRRITVDRHAGSH